MKTIVAPRPLPEDLLDLEAETKQRLADLQRDYQQRAEPYLRLLRELEAHRPAPHIMLVAETEADVEALRRGLAS